MDHQGDQSSLIAKYELVPLHGAFGCTSVS